jgi:hypothetical protein
MPRFRPGEKTFGSHPEPDMPRIPPISGCADQPARTNPLSEPLPAFDDSQLLAGFGAIQLALDAGPIFQRAIETPHEFFGEFQLAFGLRLGRIYPEIHQVVP